MPNAILIEISDGVSVRVDKIEAVLKGDTELTSKVSVGGIIYDSTFPYRVLLDLIELNSKDTSEDIQEKEFNIMKQIGTPAW